MKEALRYLQNAKEILRSVPIENNIYTDIKSVREAMGVAYLAVLKAIDEYLMQRGVDERELPQSIDGYRAMIRKHLSIYDGRLIREFESIYKSLHIAGYYRGLLDNVKMVKDAIKSAKVFIEKIK